MDGRTNTQLTGKLLDDPEQAGSNWTTGFEEVVVENHPLVVVGSRIVTSKELGPELAVSGESVCHHHPNPSEKLK
jgi:hypothetical protein